MVRTFITAIKDARHCRARHRREKSGWRKAVLPDTDSDSDWRGDSKDVVGTVQGFVAARRLVDSLEIVFAGCVVALRVDPVAAEAQGAA